jgi:hypothetical protein
MKKLWIFGDSYGVPLNNSIDWFWGKQLQKLLKCDVVENRSVLGGANEFTQWAIMKEENNINVDDFVVIISSSIYRKWFFKDMPCAGNFLCSNLEELVGKTSAKAVEQYIQHLMNPEMIHVNFHQFLGWIHYKTDKMNWNVLVLPGFEEERFPISHLYNVNGSLFDVCNNEFVSEADNLWYYRDFCKGKDQRSSHLLKDNHKILSNKIANTFINLKPLDLTNGFKKNIISKDKINLIQDQFVTIENLVYNT